LVLAPCKKEKCEISIQLHENDKLGTSYPLQWAPNSGHLQKKKINSLWGVGDPLEPEKLYDAWSIGADSYAVTVYAKKVLIDFSVDAVLVSQSVGADHSKRKHWLFVFQNGTLKIAWHDREGSGDTWSTVKTINADGQLIQHIVSFNGSRDVMSKKHDQHDLLVIKTLIWDSNAQKLDESTAKENLYVSLWGPFTKVSEAREFAVKLFECHRAYYWVLPKLRLTKFEQGSTVAIVSTEQRYIDNVLLKTNQCLPQKTARMEIINASRINNKDTLW